MLLHKDREQCETAANDRQEMAEEHNLKIEMISGDSGEIAESMHRVGEMEQLLDRLNYLISKMEKPRPSKAMIKEYLEFQQDVKKLDKYYASAEWKKDFEMDEHGVFPPDLKRGVLSEDAIYDALENNEEIQERFKQ